MENQNVTLSLPRPLLKQAKLLAASQDKSLSQLLRETLQEKVKEKADYEQARKRQFRLFRRGLDLGTDGHLKISRDEMHARKLGYLAMNYSDFLSVDFTVDNSCGVLYRLIINFIR